MRMPDHSDIGRRRQREIFIAGVGGHRPAVPVASKALEQAAQAAMSPEAWAYVAGGAGREATMDANRAAFDRWAIVPRVLQTMPTQIVVATFEQGHTRGPAHDSAEQRQIAREELILERPRAGRDDRAPARKQHRQ